MCIEFWDVWRKKKEFAVIQQTDKKSGLHFISHSFPMLRLRKLWRTRETLSFVTWLLFFIRPGFFIKERL